MRFRDLRITQKLIFGFSVICLLVVLMGSLFLKDMNSLSKIVDDMYMHPFTVSKSVLRIEINIFDIHRKMKDIAVSTSDEKLDELLREVTRLELETMREFDLVEERFLGNKETVLIARNAFQNWSPIRSRVVSYNKNGRMDEALAITQGEGAEYVKSMERDIEQLIDFATAKANEYHTAANSRFHNSLILQLSLLMLVMLLSFLAAIFLTRSITKPLKYVMKRIEKIALGNLESNIHMDQKDEIGELANSFKHMQENQKKIVAVAKRVAESDFSTTLLPRSSKDELSFSLNEMSRRLKELSNRQNEMNWLNTGLSSLSEIMQGQKSLDEIARDIIHFITGYVGAEVGCIYFLEDDHYHLMAGHALSLTEKSQIDWKPGEGLVGQTALEKQMLIEENIPVDYLVIQSGMGKTSPINLVIIPCIMENEVNALLEIGSLTKFSGVQLEFLRAIEKNIAVAVFSAQIRQQTQELLEMTQKQSAILEQQKEELRTSNEELEMKTSNLQASEEELKTQQEELQVTNEELEEKTRSLEEQKNLISKNNKALEKTGLQLQKKAEELQQSSIYKSEFLANMSHELRTPLNSMLLLAQDLKDNREKNMTDKQKESAQIIFQCGNDLLNLINEILDLSKIEAGKMDLHITPLDLNTLLNSLESTFKPLTDEKALNLHLHLDESIPPVINSDSQRLNQILNNLLANAVKFTAEGSISCSIEKSPENEETILFKVNDTGIGIPEEKHRQIFEAFQQVDGSISRKYGGTGLGLSIVRELTRMLQGKIQLESKIGVGSTFTLSLPVNHSLQDNGSTERPPLHDKNQSPPPSAVLFGHRIKDDQEDLKEEDHTILVIEDDSDFAEVLRDFCHKKSMQFLHAGSGELGLKLAREFQPDGIILDINLPGIDGWEVLDQLKKDMNTRHIPVHMMSSHEKSIDALHRGAIGYLSKPATREKLTESFALMESVMDNGMQNVLVIEDNTAMRISIKQLLSNSNIKITESRTGSDGLNKIESETFDCVIMDLGLPDITGFQLLKKLENSNKISQIPPVIIYTGMELTNEQQAELENYASSIIIKGVKSRERLLDETALFLHKVVDDMPDENKSTIRRLYNKDEQLENKKILIADDDMRNVFAIGQILEDNRMQVFKAANGQKALDILDRNPDIDLVLMDLMMPVMDGLETIRIIREEKQLKTPIIAVTARAMKEDQEKCIKAGANDYLSKPIKVDQLLSLMRLWLYKELS